MSALGDYTFITDEIESVVTTFASNATHKENLLANRANYQSAIVNSSTFLAIDADITKLTKLFICNAIKEQEATCAVNYHINTFKHKSRVANFCSANRLMLKIHDALHLGKRINIATTTKNRAKNLEFMLKLEFPELKIISITGEDHDKIETQNLIATREAYQYDVVIHNTAIGVGIDITKHVFDEVFIFADEVFGQNSNTIMQLMQRFRKHTIFNIAISTRPRPEGRDPYYYLSYEITDNDDVAGFIEKITKYMIQKDLKDSGYEKTLKEATEKATEKERTGLALEVAAHQQYLIKECMYWRKNIKDKLIRSGFDVRIDNRDLNELEMPYIKELEKAGKEARKQHIKDTFHEREHLGYTERKANKDDNNTEVFKQCRKTDVLVALKDIPSGKTRDKVLFKLINKDRYFSEIASNIFLISMSDFKFRDHIHEKRAKDPTFYMNAKNYLGTRKKNLNLLADFLGLDPHARKLKRIRTWSTRNDSEEMHDLLKALDMTSEKPIRIINRLAFRKLGIIVGSRQVRIPKAELTAEQIEEQETSKKQHKYRVHFVEDITVYKNICKYVINTPEDKDDLKNIIDFVDEELHKVIRYHINKTLDPPSNAKAA